MSDSELSDLIVELDGPIGRIILDRPNQINAINGNIRRCLPEALSMLDARVDIRVIVIRGNGPRGFCAGADIKENGDVESAIEAQHRLRTQHWVDAFERISTPTIAAIHGVCMGGGLELALACDIRMASADAVFALPESGLGLLPGAGGTQRMPRLIGIGPALDMMLTNDRLDAATAHRLNIVTRLHEDREALFTAADLLAEKIAAKPPVATQMVRRAVLASAVLSLKEGLGLERDLFALLLTTEDRREAATAFKEKRPPQFSGR
ncbi:enoyl-CoA hydratase/isomerase family protein [Sphingomonas sp. BAUL-RG-20F-R05-02]|uniref:enoyl-CoA hydratase/isomerase family protein n=1 Tax=Sphingomonas sp. BAUL-RG-20F-R05-02 TaxID=2914830 RepID=UPI001F595200|nr:enoyl-CoA hydratase/isomerase family protein [Sphingomonas sp. BAUL-RG-20F-R05-02]